MRCLVKQLGVRGPDQRKRQRMAEALKRVCVQQKELEVEIDKVEGRAKAVRKIRSQMDKMESMTEEVDEEGTEDTSADQGECFTIFALFL